MNRREFLVASAAATSLSVLPARAEEPADALLAEMIRAHDARIPALLAKQERRAGHRWRGGIPNEHGIYTVGGASGFISALANVWPRSFASLWAGDDSLQPAVDSARAAVKQNGGIPALKALAALRGFNFGASRMPGASLSDAGRESLASTYAAATATGLR